MCRCASLCLLAISTIILPTSYLGDYSPILPVVVISTILLLISSTSCNISLALSLALMAIMPTVPICIKPKTLSLQLSCSKTGCQALAAGVLLVMIVPRKTASRSLAKRVWCRFQCSTTTQSISSQARATGVSRCQILLMFSYQ